MLFFVLVILCAQSYAQKISTKKQAVINSVENPQLFKTNKKDMEVFPILIGCNKP